MYRTEKALSVYSFCGAHLVRPDHSIVAFKTSGRDYEATSKTAKPLWDVEKFLEKAGMSASAQPVIADLLSRPIPAICFDSDGQANNNQLV